MQPFLNDILEKYFDDEDYEFVPITEWSGEDLAELEVAANGELQRRADSVIKLRN